MTDWKPIESLRSHPLGYEVLLLAGRSHFVGLRDARGEIVASHIREHDGLPAKIGATHWMPLPSPPDAR